MTVETRGHDEAMARLTILDLASEDCYWIIEFIQNLHNAYSSLAEAERRTAIIDTYRRLVNEGLVRIHRGDQCSGNVRAANELTVASESLDEAFEDVWGFRFGVDEPNLCVCNTETTLDAYGAAYREMHGGAR